jgi:hypothetical protein
MADRPTDSAQMMFNLSTELSRAAAHSAKNKGDVAQEGVALAVNHIAQGLSHLSEGLRATYILLEEVQRSVKRTQRFGAGHPE